MSSQGCRQCPPKLDFLEPFVEVLRVDWRNTTQGIKPRNAVDPGAEPHQDHLERQEPSDTVTAPLQNTAPGNYGLGPASGDGGGKRRLCSHSMPQG